jgi:TRAP-type C4-dicarboxylate transport system substrate-binding protein
MLESELYTSLQTGVIDGVFLPWDISAGYNLQDIAEHACFVDMGGTVDIALTINQDTWNGLPADLRELMLAVGEEASKERLAELLLQRRQEAIEAFDAAGITRAEMPFEEKVRWAEALDDMPGDWIDEMEEKGLAGKKVMVRYLEILDEMGHQFPRQWAAAHRG